MATLFSNYNDHNHNNIDEHNDNENYLRSLPPGYRFVPCDHELITYYLRRKVEGKHLPPNLMHEVYVYDHCPFQLTSGSYKAQGEAVWYFFTKRVRKYENGSRPSRAAGNGFWKSTAANKIVKDTQGREIGYKNVLAYFLGHSLDKKGVKTPLQMHEYSLNDDSQNHNHYSTRAKIPTKTNKAVRANSSNKSKTRTRFLDGLVLCKIYYSKNNNKNNNNDNADDDDGTHAQTQELEGEETQEYDEPEPTTTSSLVNNIQHDHPPKISENFSNNTNHFQTYYNNNSSSTIYFDDYHSLTQENYLVSYPCDGLPPVLMFDEFDQTTLDYYDGNMYQSPMNYSSFVATGNQDTEVAQSSSLLRCPSGSSGFGDELSVIMQDVNRFRKTGDKVV